MQRYTKSNDLVVQNRVTANPTARNKNIVDLFVNDNIKMPMKANPGRNLLCKSVQGNAQMPE